MASLVALCCGCMDSFKSILTSQDFGSEYEILCTELSVQWLRIRLWGQSVGLHIDGAHNLQQSIFNRPEVETTVTLTVNSIAYLLAEIEALRRRYELRARLIPETPEDEKVQRDSKPHSGLFRPARHLQQRMRDNQKQKSFLTIAKWAICDAKRFDEKVKRLKNLLDGLEDISKAAGIAQFHTSPPELITQVPIAANEDPPPYSVEPNLQQAQRVEVVSPAASRSSSTEDSQLLEHYALMKQYSTFFQINVPPRSRALHALFTLQDRQFRELRVDVCHDLCRRWPIGEVPPLPRVAATNHPRRVQAQEKLSRLSSGPFGHLVTDVVFELERRFPSLKDGAQRTDQSLIVPNLARNRRHGYVPPQNSPPPLLRHRASHSETLNRTVSNPGWPLQTPSFGSNQTCAARGQSP